ncbi:hypothetical protein [Maritalea sp.]|uniref:hypothetical protein n=1 Tax=Maritalea sp. TaxID=2003361 RepID=UPI0039E70DE2
MKNNIFSHHFDRLLNAGQGNKGDKWTNAAFAKATGIGADAIGKIRSQGQIPHAATYKKIADVFFLKKNEMNDIDAKAALHNAWLEVQDSDANRKTAVARIDAESFSLNDVWHQVLRIKTNEFSVPISGASKSSNVNYGGFASDELRLFLGDNKFFIPFTDELVNLVKSKKIKYQINHTGVDFEDSPLSKCASLADEFDIQGAIEKYRKIYSDLVIAEFASTKTHKPYNMKKLGVWNLTSYIPIDRDETTAATVELYETDYFTNWIMSQVYADIRRKVPYWLDEMTEYPTLEIGNRQFHLPHLTPSIGLNCFIICKPKNGVPKICFTRLKNESSNGIQHGKLHLPVNEGLNHEDIPHGTTDVDLTVWWKRMVAEELGADLNTDKFEFEASNVFVDHTVGEFGVLGILTTEYSVEELNNFRTSARDGGREFKGSLIGVAATEFDLISWVLGQDNSVNSFVSYTPNLIDILVGKRVLKRIFTSA